MDQVHVLRHKVLVEGQSARKVAKELGLSRNTVKRYLRQAAPVRHESEPRARPTWEAVRARLEALLAESPQWTTDKQRLTATRLHAMLVGEGFTIGVTLVKDAVREWKRKRREVFVPLEYPPGELAEVDFFEVTVELDGVRRKLWMFLMRLMASGRDFACLYDRQDQVAFLDGHVRAFEHFGAVPQRIAYDNLKAAVRKHLVGCERELTERFEALASHFLFEPCFCRPRTGHDKGGVEARGKVIRWQHLVPIPATKTIADARAELLAKLDASFDAQRFALELPHMQRLPEGRFDARRIVEPSASRRSLCSIDGALYSVPCAWAGLDVTAYVGPDDVTLIAPRLVRDGAVESATSVRHERARFGGKVVDYRHYVPELARKPQAVRQVAASLTRDLGEPFGRTWRHLVDEHGPRQASRIFARVLGHVATRGTTVVAAVLERAHAAGEPVLLALGIEDAPSKPEAAGGVVVPTALQSAEVASGCAADYDRILIGGGA